MSALVLLGLILAGLGGAALLAHLWSPGRLAGCGLLVPLAIYCAAAEVDTAPLAGASADRVADLALGLLAVGLAAVLFKGRRLSPADFLGRPVGWLVLLLLAGLVFAPFSLAPVGTVIRSVVALCLVGSALMLVDRYGWIHVVAASSFGALVLVMGSLLWEGLGPGTTVARPGVILDSGFAGLARHQGLTSQPNQLGRVCAGLLVAGALLSRSRRYRSFGWLCQGGGLAGLYYAQSRTAIVVGISVALLAHARHRRQLAVATVVVVALGAGLLLWSTGAGGVETVTRKGAGSQELSTATGRASLWRVTIELAEQDPLIGVGAFATDKALAGAVLDGRIGFRATDAHNIFLNTLLAQGIFGLGLLLAFVVAATADVLRGRALPGAGILALSVLGLGLTENTFWKPNSTLVLLAIGVVGLSGQRVGLRKRHEVVAV